MTNQEALALYYAIRYNLTHPKHKEAVDIAFAALERPDVVRCKECMHKDRMSGDNVILCTRRNKLIRMKPDDFCSYGERGNGGDNG